MDFDFYQDAASGTDQFAGQNAKRDEGLMIPLLGIAGETGTLLAEFKKKIRDKESYEGFQEKAEEELGDILRYLSNIASRLGWSPVIRALLKRKRKSQPKTDEVEDGARAIILEELVVAFVYGNAKERKYYENIKHLDSEMLSTIKRIVRHLEVGTRRTKDWED